MKNKIEIISMLVRMRDFFENQEPFNIINTEQVETINNLVFGYFCERRNRVPIPLVSAFMNNKDLSIYINDNVLDYINDEVVDLLEIDWQQRYILKCENNFLKEIDENDYF